MYPHPVRRHAPTAARVDALVALASRSLISSSPVSVAHLTNAPTSAAISSARSSGIPGRSAQPGPIADNDGDNVATAPSAADLFEPMR